MDMFFCRLAHLDVEDLQSRPVDNPHRRHKRDAPNVIYPEILVLVDYDGYL